MPVLRLAQAGALLGTNGTPSASNRYVTDTDPRLSAIGGIPSGVICMWSGTVATIPSGWALCDGANGTPDLRDRFVVGARQDDSGKAKTNLTGSLTQSGGAASHHHADHAVTQPSDHAAQTHAGAAVADHAAQSHAGAAVADHTGLTHSGAAVADHAAHTHGYGTLAVASHTVVSTKQGSSSGNVVTTATHTVSGSTGNPSATLTHTVTQPGAHGNAGTLTHAVTQPGDHAALVHSVTQPSQHAALAHNGAAVDAHDTLSAPQPYYALAFIMKL